MSPFRSFRSRNLTTYGLKHGELVLNGAFSRKFRKACIRRFQYATEAEPTGPLYFSLTPRPDFPLDLADIEAYRDWRVDLAGFHRGAFCGYVLVFVIPLEGQPS
jgi:hypothetical protein